MSSTLAMCCVLSISCDYIVLVHSTITGTGCMCTDSYVCGYIMMCVLHMCINEKILVTEWDSLIVLPCFGEAIKHSVGWQLYLHSYDHTA